LQLLKII